MTSFSSVLVANRGEIAGRVIRACREAGLRSIAVYSDADADAPYVRLADDAVRLGPTPAAESYLSIERVIAAAARVGRRGRPPRLRLPVRAGRVRARRRRRRARLHRPDRRRHGRDGPQGPRPRDRRARRRAGHAAVRRPDAVPADAYPVLVKAAAGGGGKGMRIVREASALAEAIEAAGREAASAFGDDTLLVETYVEAGRHVEVQVFGDDARPRRPPLRARLLGAAPPPEGRRGGARVRARPTSCARTLHESSVALCREVGYTGAGTVEFLVADDGAGGQRPTSWR